MQFSSQSRGTKWAYSDIPRTAAVFGLARTSGWSSRTVGEVDGEVEVIEVMMEFDKRSISVGLIVLCLSLHELNKVPSSLC